MFQMFFTPFSISCRCCCEPLSGAINCPFEQKAETIIKFTLAIANESNIRIRSKSNLGTDVALEAFLLAVN